MTEQEDADELRYAKANLRDEKADARDSKLDFSINKVDKHEQALLSNTRIILWVSFCLLILLLASVLRSYYIEDQVRQLNAETEQLIRLTEDAESTAKTARESFETMLEDSISRENEHMETLISVDKALEAVQRIEEQLCNGQCGEDSQP